MVQKPSKPGRDTSHGSATRGRTDGDVPAHKTARLRQNPQSAKFDPDANLETGAPQPSSGRSASRRGIVYLDPDTLRPIKPPIVVARQLDRRDFAMRWQAEFGQKLADARLQAGLSQSDLARRSGVRQPHISKLEAGEMEPRLSTIFAIADTLGILARSLFPDMSWQRTPDVT
jgi:ribosome-binding protein aMBF1 (putative translation factor)